MKTVVLSIALFVSASWASAQSESSEEVDLLQVLKDKRDFAMEAIKAKYFLDLRKLQKMLTEANDLEGATKVEEEIALAESEQPSENTSARKFSKNYMIGTKWEYEARGKKYLMVFERRTYKLYGIDGRGRKFVQLQREWKIEDIEGRRISTARGTIPMTLNKSLTEISMSGATAKLVGE